MSHVFKNQRHLIYYCLQHVLMEFHIQDDEHGTERLYKQARNVEIQSTDIFDQFRRRLNRMDSNLGILLKSSELKSDLDCHNVGVNNSFESGSTGNAANFTVDSRNKPKGLDERARPSFSLGF